MVFCQFFLLNNFSILHPSITRYESKKNDRREKGGIIVTLFPVDLGLCSSLETYWPSSSRHLIFLFIYFLHSIFYSSPQPPYSRDIWFLILYFCTENWQQQPTVKNIYHQPIPFLNALIFILPVSSLNRSQVDNIVEQVWSWKNHAADGERGKL